MLKINVSKGQPVGDNPTKESVSIIIDKVFDDKDLASYKPGEEFYKALDAKFNKEATAIAEALQTTLPGGVWDRLVGIMVRRHARFLTITPNAAAHQTEGS